MFVRKSKHDELAAAYRILQSMHRRLEHEHATLTKQWNNLVRSINAKGGEAFLEGRGQQQPLLSKDDIKRLLSLCHPDKHAGKQIAQDMTVKLLELRKQMEQAS